MSAHDCVMACACVHRSDLACEMAIAAVKTVTTEKGKNQREIDIKRYARVEKIPGGTIEDSEVLRGVMINKDVTHSRMKRSGTAIHVGIPQDFMYVFLS